MNSPYFNSPGTSLFLSLILVVSLSACSDSVTGPDKFSPPRQLSTQELEVAARTGDFGINLFKAIVADDSTNNIFVSPLSVSMAMGMLLNGSRGDTRAELESSLQFAGLSETEINDAYRTLIDLLTHMDEKVRVDIANSIWYDKAFAANPAFLETNRKHFYADVESLDFGSSGAVTTINSWVDNATNGRIPTIIESIPPEAVMYLINALYFKGDWRMAFDAKDTGNRSFTLESGVELQVPMMRHKEPRLPIYNGSNFTGVDLAYGDSLYSMTLLIPHNGTSVNELASSLDASTWDDLVNNLRAQELGAFLMPKFTLEYKITLNDALKALGIEKAFDESEADLTGINDVQQLFVSRVLHKTFVSVDELGTEAAAATAVEVGVTSVPPTIAADRPFLFAIRDQHSGTILFVGRMMDPR